MVELLSEHLFIAVIVYLISFLAIGKFALHRFLSPKIELRKLSVDALKVTLRSFERGEEISFILCGFAIISLVFIITLFQDNFGEGEIMIIFFSLAFIFEIVAAFVYHDTTKFYSLYIGAAFQYSGILSMLCGFFSYFNSVMSWSFGIYAVFYFGLAMFIWLTIREIRRDIELAREEKL